MTDIDLAKDLWPDVPLASAVELTAVRDRLTAEIAAESELPGRTVVIVQPGAPARRAGVHARRPHWAPGADGDCEHGRRGRRGGRDRSRDLIWRHGASASQLGD